MKTQDCKLFAHSTENISRLEWELLSDHLLAVGNHSRGTAAGFGAARWGEIAGLLHDLGKAKPEFQAKLRGENNAEPHSGEGALYARDRIGGRAGKMMAYCIVGHHAGLPNGITFSEARPPTPLSERLKSTRILELPDGVSLVLSR